MPYDERDMARRTARAVLDALPSSYLPAEVRYEEAIEIGKKLIPEWLLMKVTNPDGAKQIDVMLEFTGRGLLFAAVDAVPQWLRSIWVTKVDCEDQGKVLEYTTDMVYHIPDAEKFAAHWVELACGYSADDVIEKIISQQSEPEEKQSEEIEDRLSSLEEM